MGGILHQDHDAFGLAEVGQEAPGPEELIVRVLREATEVHVTELRDPLRVQSTCGNAWRRGSGSSLKEMRATICQSAGIPSLKRGMEADTQTCDHLIAKVENSPPMLRCTGDGVLSARGNVPKRTAESEGSREP